jgi:hypothetical protein
MGETGSIILNATGVQLTPSKPGVFIDPVNQSEQDYLAFYNPNTKEVTYGGSYVSLSDAQSFSGTTGPSFGIYKNNPDSMGISVNSLRRVTINKDYSIFENIIQNKLQPLYDYFFITNSNFEITMNANTSRHIYIIPFSISGIKLYLPPFTGNVQSGNFYKIITVNHSFTLFQSKQDSTTTFRIRIIGVTSLVSQYILNRGTYDIFAVKNDNGSSVDDSGCWYVYKSGS